METIKQDKYTFKITSKINTKYNSNEINSIFYQIGGREDCISLIVYYSAGVASSACLPMVEYSDECVEGEIKLDRGGGTQHMLKALLRYIHTKHPTIKLVDFDDMSRIDCATNVEISSAKNLRPRSLVKPIDLCRFSIAFNGCTWYEKYFNAKLTDASQHSRYRAAVDTLLSMPKPDINELHAPSELHDKIHRYLQGATTISDFFTAIPKTERCEHARKWLLLFVGSKLGNNFSHNNWSIELPVSHGMFGGAKKNNKSKRYYCPKGFKRIHYTQRQCIETSENI